MIYLVKFEYKITGNIEYGVILKRIFDNPE